MPGPQDTVETRNWTVRQIALKTYYLTVELNGGQRDIKRTVYGAPELGIEGLTVRMEETCAWRDRVDALAKVAKWVAGGLGGLLITILSLIVGHVI